MHRRPIVHLFLLVSLVSLSLGALPGVALAAGIPTAVNSSAVFGSPARVNEPIPFTITVRDSLTQPTPSSQTVLSVTATGPGSVTVSDPLSYTPDGMYSGSLTCSCPGTYSVTIILVSDPLYSNPPAQIAGSPYSVPVTGTTSLGLKEAVLALDPDPAAGFFDAPNRSAGAGRQTALVNRVDEAVLALANGDPAAAADAIESALKKMDGLGNDDWLTPAGSEILRPLFEAALDLIVGGCGL